MRKRTLRLLAPALALLVFMAIPSLANATVKLSGATTGEAIKLKSTNLYFETESGGGEGKSCNETEIESSVTKDPGAKAEISRGTSTCFDSVSRWSGTWKKGTAITIGKTFATTGLEIVFEVFNRNTGTHERDCTYQGNLNATSYGLGESQINVNSAGATFTRVKGTSACPEKLTLSGHLLATNSSNGAVSASELPPYTGTGLFAENGNLLLEEGAPISISKSSGFTFISLVGNEEEKPSLYCLNAELSGKVGAAGSHVASVGLSKLTGSCYFEGLASSPSLIGEPKVTFDSGSGTIEGLVLSVPAYGIFGELIRSCEYGPVNVPVTYPNEKALGLSLTPTKVTYNPELSVRCRAALQSGTISGEFSVTSAGSSVGVGP